MLPVAAFAAKSAEKLAEGRSSYKESTTLLEEKMGSSLYTFLR